MEHPGNTDFDVKDRLAIINLCNAYANHFDKNEIWELVYALYRKPDLRHMSFRHSAGDRHWRRF